MILNVIGDIFCDILAKNVRVLPTWGADTLSSKITMIAGGSSLNSIIHASHIRKKSPEPLIALRLFSSVAKDMQGQVCLQALKENDIDINNVVLMDNVSHSTGTCIVISNSDDRSFITDRGCISNLSVDWFDINKLLDCNHLHYGGFYNCDEMQVDCIELFRKVSSSY